MTPPLKKLATGFCSLTLTACAVLAPAWADDAAPAVDPHAIKVWGLVDTGIYANASGSTINAGQLFTDKDRQWVLNQAMLTAERDLDPNAADYDWGFKLQGFYGTDARYPHFIGMFDRNTSDRGQFDIIEANLTGHAPWLTPGGIDVKAGAYSSPIGYEVVPANSNPLYSHSYTVNYTDPLKLTGVLTTTHITPTVDFWLGADSGVNTTYTQRGQVNGHMSALTGLGFNNLLGGKLTVLALSHIGPTNAEARSDQPLGSPYAAHKGRYINDIVATYKPDDVWTFVTEANYTRDDLLNAEAFGFVQYGMYQVNSWLSLIGRAEVFADPQSQFVASYQGNRDPVNVERGIPTDYPVLQVPNRQGVTYGALTLGANVKLPDVPEALSGTMIRPEVRWDQSLNGVNAFNYGGDGLAHDKGQFSVGMDLVIPVSF